MSHRSRIPATACLCLVLLSGAAAACHAQAVIAEATSDFYYDSFHRYVNHSPCSFDEWSHAAEDGPTFDRHLTAGDPDCLDYHWHLQAGDGLSYRGHWTEAVPEEFVWGDLHIDATLACVLRVTAPVLLNAERSVAWSATPRVDEHAVLLEGPDGGTESLFGDDPAVVSVQRLLQPGDHRITIRVMAHQFEPPEAWYNGAVTVSWAETVDGRSRSWGAVKARYR